MFKTGKGAAAIVKDQGLVQISDESALHATVTEVLAAQPGWGGEGRPPLRWTEKSAAKADHTPLRASAGRPSFARGKDLPPTADLTTTRPISDAPQIQLSKLIYLVGLTMGAKHRPR